VRIHGLGSGSFRKTVVHWLSGFRVSIVSVLAVAVIILPVMSYTLIRERGRRPDASTVSSKRIKLAGLSRSSVADKDFPQLGQTARFGDSGNDRQGYGAAAYDNHVAYVVNQGVPTGVEDGEVDIETFTGSYEDGAEDTAKWTGNIDYPTAKPVGTIKLLPPAGSRASGFGYGVAMNKNYVVVSAKWSQQIFVYDYSGACVQTINKPEDDARYAVDNFGESIALAGTVLLAGAPNSTVDGFDDAGMVFRVDLGTGTSSPLLAPENDPSIQEGALAGQSVAIGGKRFAVGAPGYMTAQGSKDYITGLVQMFSTNQAFEGNLTVDMAKGSYPAYGDTSVAGLGRSIVFGNDGKTLYAGNPSCDTAASWSRQVGRISVYDTDTKTESYSIVVNDGAYVGGALAIGTSNLGNDTLYVSYQTSDGSAGMLAGYAIMSKGAQFRATITPYKFSDSRFGALGLLGGAIVPFSHDSETKVDGVSKKVTHQRLLVTGENFVYVFEDQLPLKLEKVADPVDGTRVFPGQSITYSIKASNPNPRTSPATATITDDLSGVLDFAKDSAVTDLSVDPADAGAPVFDSSAKKLTWNGQVQGKSSLSVGYKMTVKKSQNASYYDSEIMNRASCDRSDDAPQTTHKLGKIDVDKVILDAKGHQLASNAKLGLDQDYSYLLSIKNQTDTDAPIATVVDDMSSVLDDADFNAADITVTPAGSGSVRYDTGSHGLTWSGALKSGAEVKITVPIHTHKSDATGGDRTMSNGLSNDRGPDAKDVVSPIGDVGLAKEARNAQGLVVSRVMRGRLVRYEITYTNNTDVTLYNASFADDLSRVLPNAGHPTDLKAVSSDSAHVVAQPTFDGTDLRWSDTSGIKPGEVITFTYQVSVNADAERDSTLVNSVASTQSTDKAEKKVVIYVPVSVLPLSGGTLAVMVSLMVFGVALIVLAIVMSRRQIV
jgi:fimbrial isopeptide formation D2 family protein